MKNDFLLKNIKNKRSNNAIIARTKIGNLKWKRPNKHIIIIGIIQLIENERILSIFFFKRKLNVISFSLSQSQVTNAYNKYILSKFPTNKLEELKIKKPLNNITIEVINDLDVFRL